MTMEVFRHKMLLFGGIMGFVLIFFANYFYFVMGKEALKSWDPIKRTTSDLIFCCFLSGCSCLMTYGVQAYWHLSFYYWETLFYSTSCGFAVGMLFCYDRAGAVLLAKDNYAVNQNKYQPGLGFRPEIVVKELSKRELVKFVLYILLAIDLSFSPSFTFFSLIWPGMGWGQFILATLSFPAILAIFFAVFLSWGFITQRVVINGRQVAVAAIIGVVSILPLYLCTFVIAQSPAQIQGKLEDKIGVLGALETKLENKLSQVESVKSQYDAEINSLQLSVRRESRRQHIVSYQEASRNDKISYNISLIQEKEAYRDQLEKLAAQMDQALSETRFLRVKAQDDLRMVRTLKSNDVSRLIRDIDFVTEKYVPDSNELVIQIDRSKLKSPEQIWQEIKQ